MGRHASDVHIPHLHVVLPGDGRTVTGPQHEAQKWLAKAIQRTEKELASDETSWNRRATLQLLRDEAVSVVKQNKAPEVDSLPARSASE